MQDRRNAVVCYRSIGLRQCVEGTVDFSLFPVVDDGLDMARPEFVDGLKPTLVFHELVDQLQLHSLLLLNPFSHEGRNVHD